MTDYFRPIVMTDSHRSDGSFSLAGGWCWFDTVEVLSRDGSIERVAASEVPNETLQRLTEVRPQISGLSMSRPQVMGILNVTPDSFSDGGDHNQADSAVQRAGQMISDGATIIDVGGESTRPGAETVSVHNELQRIVAPIEAVRRSTDVAISIDTRKAEVAKAAQAAGATMLNDVSALTYDPSMAAVAAKTAAPICLMHAQGDPQTMQDNPQYDDVILDVYDFLANRIAVAEQAGVAKSQIVIDPGIGFGKTQQHNLRLLQNISLFHGLGCPILLGASRKRFIGTIGHAPDAKDRLGGSVAVALYALSQGVQILRVHDTFATKQAIDLHMAMIEAQKDDA